MKEKPTKACRVGLTGGIASGKSSAARCFAALGIEVISADEIARTLLSKNSQTLAQVVELFGQDLLTQEKELDRGKLRQLIFNNVSARKQLDDITHPAIGKRLLASAEQSKSSYVILEIPLLVEANMMTLVDRVLVVNIDKEEQIKRLMLRDECSHEHAIKALAAQISAETRLTEAHDIIHNSGLQNKLKQQVALLHNKYLQLLNQERLTKNQINEIMHTHNYGLDLH